MTEGAAAADSAVVRLLSDAGDNELVKQWLPRLFRWSNDAIVLLDLDHVVVGGNHAAERLFGWRGSDALGRPISEMVRSDRRARLKQIQRLAERHLMQPSSPGCEDPFCFDWTVRRPGDGAQRDVTMTVSGIRDDAGQLLGYGLVAIDVTAARRAEALQRALARLSTTALELRDVGAVFDAAVSIPFACLDADHVTLLELLTTGQQVRPVAQAGWPKPELLGSFDIDVDSDTALAKALVNQRSEVFGNLLPSSGPTMPRTVEPFGVDVGSAVSVCVVVGGTTWGTLCASWSEPRRIGPEDVDMLQTVANVVATVIERERNDQLRLQHERTLRLGSLGQMAAGVAHDLANVLAGIEAIAAVEATRPEVPAAAVESLSRIRGEAQLGHQIIEGILDFARLAPIEPEPLAVGSWLIRERDVLCSGLPEGVALVVDVGAEPGGGPVVRGDPCGLRRILDNLIANAVDAVAGRGTITLGLTMQHVGPTDTMLAEGLPTGEWARLDVTDDGAGIDPAILPRIFEPFFTTKRHRQGTGLGLAQVHGLASQHGGQATVTSTPGAGSTFSVWLPVAGAPRWSAR